MATTITIPFTMSTPAHIVKLTDPLDTTKVQEFQGKGQDPYPNFVVRAVWNEHGATGATSGNVVVSIA